MKCYNLQWNWCVRLYDIKNAKAAFLGMEGGTAKM